MTIAKQSIISPSKRQTKYNRQYKSTIIAALRLMMLLTFTQPAHGQIMEEKYDKAKQLFEKSKMLANLRTAESMRAALQKFEQAQQLFQELNAQQEETYCLEWLGSINSSLGNKQKALDYFSQALPILRAINDQSGQATALHNIGNVYSDLGEKQKALEFLQ